MSGPSPTAPCPHWPASRQDESACFTCPIAPLPCIYEKEGPGRPVTPAGEMARTMLQLPVIEIQQQCGLSRAQIYRLKAAVS